MKRKLLTAEYFLNHIDNKVLNNLAQKAYSKFNDVNCLEFIRNYYLYSTRITSELKEFIMYCKNNSLDCFIIKGLDYNVNELQDTPVHWNEEKDEYTRFIQFKHFIIAANFGYPYSWKTQQNGSYISDVLPISGFENHQQGFGSSGGLRFHTEDPFHSARADFFTLMCMRNPIDIPTTLFPLDLETLPEKIKNELFKKQFTIIPDESHTDLTCENNLESNDRDIFEVFNQKRKISILYGRKETPYLRIDPEIMSTDGLTKEAADAYNYICKEIEGARVELVLRPGEIFAINNHRLAHGRGSFTANYDGKDRWLERILTLEDIRKTISYRKSEFEYMMVK